MEQELLSDNVAAVPSTFISREVFDKDTRLWRRENTVTPWNEIRLGCIWKITRMQTKISTSNEGKSTYHVGRCVNQAGDRMMVYLPKASIIIFNILFCRVKEFALFSTFNVNFKGFSTFFYEGIPPHPFIAWNSNKIS